MTGGVSMLYCASGGPKIRHRNKSKAGATVVNVVAPAEDT